MAVIFYERSFPDEMQRNRRWREMAEKMNIPIEVDPVKEQQRKDRLLAVAMQDFLGD
jgi:hypothetical protein